jgi:hypothetical protein
MQIIKKSRKKRTLRPSWTADQERRYKELVVQLEAAGVKVRREELKRGHCWKAQSGACRSLGDHFVFIDSRLSADDQVAFLAAQAREVEVLAPSSQIPSDLIAQVSASAPQ